MNDAFGFKMENPQMSIRIEHLEASETMRKATGTIDRLRAELDAERKAHAETKLRLGSLIQENYQLHCDLSAGNTALDNTLLDLESAEEKIRQLEFEVDNPEYGAPPR